LCQERYRICAGGGIYSSGALTVANSTINDNTAPCWGGGIYASGALTVVNSTISSNSAMPDGGVGLPCLSGEGGGIFVGGSGTLTITNSTLSGNMSQLGGGIFNSGQVTIGDTVLDAGG
jgi:predicted outer membrane repeat protein